MLFVVVIIMIISVALALWSLKQQNKLEEINRAKKSLAGSRVIYHRDSLESLEE
jgi:cytochrome oxidase assembly protein ShyY1